MWPEQQSVAAQLERHREVVALKARQLGLTWLVVALALRELLFNPISTVLLFSKRDDEASELLYRLSEMHGRLPDWMKSDPVTVNRQHEFAISTGSRALAFATTGGRSYTASLVLIDEADHVPDLQSMLSAAKPCVDAGGRLILLSTVDKSQPESPFKKIFRAARSAENSFHPIFLPWTAAPWRTQEWYAEQRKTIVTATGSEDDLWQEYPASEEQALAPRQLDKRIPTPWLLACFSEARPIDADQWYPAAHALPSIPGLVVYARPVPGRPYGIGGDPAEGNPTSDDSALSVLDATTGEEVAILAGKIEPTILADYIAQLSGWYNGAAVMVERNNHGHAVIAQLSNLGITPLTGHDGKTGWMSSTLGKTKLYDTCADAFRNREVTIHNSGTFHQLASIDGSTLRAPDGQHDDKADAFALACAARLKAVAASQADEEPVFGAAGFAQDFCGGSGGFSSVW